MSEKRTSLYEGTGSMNNRMQTTPLVKIRLEQRNEVRRRYRMNIPRWRQPIFGYIACFPLVSIGVLGLLLGNAFLPSHFYFPDVFIYLAVVVIALLWGIGPALFAVALGAVALDYFVIPPVKVLTIQTGPGLLQILPFILAGVITAFISGQRENARLQSLLAEQLANKHAEELEKTNQELARANQLKDQFLSIASHELKTPITSIRGQAQILLRRLAKQRNLPDEVAGVQAALEKIDQQTHRLNDLVNDLLNISSIRSGKMQLRLASCNINEACHNVVEDQRQLTNRPIELEVPAGSVVIQADCDRLSQVLVNLVSNAIKYSPPESLVQVALSEQPETIRIAVRDHGQGIQAEEQERIFDTFYRARDAQQSSQDGWGLGLAICKDIVERHNGRIWCESVMGRGSVFYFEVPTK